MLQELDLGALLRRRRSPHSNRHRSVDRVRKHPALLAVVLFHSPARMIF